MTIILAILSAGVWAAIFLIGNDLHEPPPKELWRLLIAACALNVVALII